MDVGEALLLNCHADDVGLLAQSADFLFQVTGCGLRVFGTRIGEIS